MVRIRLKGLFTHRVYTLIVGSVIYFMNMRELNVNGPTSVIFETINMCNMCPVPWTTIYSDILDGKILYWVGLD